MHASDKSRGATGVTRARSRKVEQGRKAQCSGQQMVCETGFAEFGSNDFVPLELQPQDPEFLHYNRSQKWSEFAFRIGRMEMLQNLRSSIRRISNELPEKVEKIYAECEVVSKIKLDSESRKLFYRKFSRMAQGFAVLQSWEVEILVGQLQLANGVDDSQLQRITSEKMQLASEASGAGRSAGVFDFQRFIYLLVEVIKEVRELQNTKPPASSLRDLLPLDPHGKKVYWDVLIFGIILYCCFEVRFDGLTQTLILDVDKMNGGRVRREWERRERGASVEGEG